MNNTITGADAHALRKALGMSQVRFAARLGVDPSTVSMWDRGLSQPSPLAQEKLQALLDATIAKGEHMAHSP